VLKVYTIIATSKELIATLRKAAENQLKQDSKLLLRDRAMQPKTAEGTKLRAKGTGLTSVHVLKLTTPT
jgi:hypothetical protein